MHRRRHIHQTKIVTTMSHLPARGLDKKQDISCNKPKNTKIIFGSDEATLKSSNKAAAGIPNKIIITIK